MPSTRTRPEREAGAVELHSVAEIAELDERHRSALELAAIVAYEHHIMIDGGGYPALHDSRGAQYASRLVHICDVYDALRTNRPYRHAWDSERAVGYIESRAGIEFDPAIVQSFTAMMRKWDHRIAIVAA